ncbi:hypothetical protein Dimus_019829 [Dionaea muscipula]
MEDSGDSAQIDEIYEFSAPRFFDFIDGETEEEARKAELWFKTALSYGPSPFMLRVKTSRNAEPGTLCDFSDADMEVKREPECSVSTNMSSKVAELGLVVESMQTLNMPQSLLAPSQMKENMNLNMTNKENVNPIQSLNMPQSLLEPAQIKENMTNKETNELSILNPQSVLEPGQLKENINSNMTNKETNEGQVAGNTIHKEKESEPAASSVLENELSSDLNSSISIKDECTPKPSALSSKRDGLVSGSQLQQRAKSVPGVAENPLSLKSKHRSLLSSSHARSIKPPPSARRDANLKNSSGTANLIQENQAIKRQKLEGGRLRQILNIKPQNLPHKSKPGGITGNITSNFCSSTAKSCKEDRKIYVRETAAPFVSMAEMMKKFQSSTREIALPQNSLSHGGKPHLTLTRPKEPEFETAQRVRSVRVKSSAELEEEMMAKMPKFKARPLNKKILEAPTLHVMPKSVPQPPEFQEFHLETMTRAKKNGEVPSSNSAESSHQNDTQWKPPHHHQVEPKTPLLHTSMRARPSKVKSSIEIEQEELERIPKFKARPLNKKIFESKGDLGLFCNNKKQVTIPQEFHFAIDERIPPPSAKIVELFDKLSLEPNHDYQMQRNTKPSPFHLQTEERGAEKERKLVMEIMQKQLEEERARIPKAIPYPYTTDYPVIPPKPEPKQCTRPEPFELESLVRHEEEMQKEMEERQQKEIEEAEIRIFKAQPIMKEDPIPLPEKERKPLTQVQEFNLVLEHRAVDRAEFDNKVKEKESMHKRYREEAEAAKMVEEEKALKQLRRTLVPHARPVPDFANPFIPQKSCKESTKARSPNLRIISRKERQKTNVTLRTASAASCMR